MNLLKMDIRQSIITLSDDGWSQRKIARELGINRETVAKYRQEKRDQTPSNPDIVPAGTSDSSDSKPAIPPPGSTEVEPEVSTPKPAILPAGSGAGRKSQCESFRTEIAAGLDAGLTAQRIYQDLVSDHQFKGSYDSVKRFVRHLGLTNPLPFRRMETQPGEQAQVDYGQGPGWLRRAADVDRMSCAWS